MSTDNLPNGWARVTLEDHIEIAARIGWRGLKRHEYTKEGPLFLSVKDITEYGNITYGDVADHLSDFRYDESPEIQLRDNDILISKDGTIGKVGFVEHMPERTTVNSSILVVRPRPSILPKYLFHYFRGPFFQGTVKEKIAGTAVPHLFQHDIKKFNIDVPPLREQERIVSRVDQFLEELKTAKQALTKLPALVRQLKQSTLVRAFSGKLSEHDSNDEPVEELLRRVRRPRQPFSRPSGQLPLLPSYWTWVSLEDIADVKGGVTKGRRFGARRTIEMPYLRVANVQAGHLDLRVIRKIEVLPDEVGEYTLHYGDVLFTEGGDRDKLGRGSVWRDEIPSCLHQNHIFRARVPTKDILPEFVSFYSQSPFARDYFYEVASQTVNLASINISNLRKLPIPLPSTQEQRRLVSRVTEILDRSDALLRTKLVVDGIIGQIEQSILGKAFRGELVPQDPNDEPATILLERIKNQDTKRQGSKGSRI